jgi:hypothetical protein
MGACVGERVLLGKSRISSRIESSLIRLVDDPCWIEGRRDGILDHDDVFVLLILQSTPSGLLRAPNASTDQPKRV